MNQCDVIKFRKKITMTSPGQPSPGLFPPPSPAQSDYATTSLPIGCAVPYGSSPFMPVGSWKWPFGNINSHLSAPPSLCRFTALASFKTSVSSSSASGAVESPTAAKNTRQRSPEPVVRATAASLSSPPRFSIGAVASYRRDHSTHRNARRRNGELGLTAGFFVPGEQKPQLFRGK